MNTFPLKIVTPDGVHFDGVAEELIVRATTGDIGILAGHINCVAPLGMGQAMVVVNGERRYAACIGGMLSVVDNHVTLVPLHSNGQTKLTLIGRRILSKEPNQSLAIKMQKTQNFVWQKPA